MQFGKTLVSLLLVAVVAMVAYLGYGWWVTPPHEVVFVAVDSRDRAVTPPAAFTAAVDSGQLDALVADAVAVGIGRIDTAAVAATMTGLPWVRRARVSREDGFNLRIAIEAHRPRFVLNDTALINDAGERYLAPLSDVPADLPRLYGDDVAQLIAQYDTLNTKLAELPFRITRLYVEAGVLRVRLNGPILVTLGMDDVAARFDKVIAVLRRTPDRLYFRRVDARQPQALAVGLRLDVMEDTP